jgi:iron complex transport system substrate-binding protein
MLDSAVSDSATTDRCTPSRRCVLVSAALATIDCRRDALAKRGARRLVSIAPNTTEMLFALGFGARVVGVSSLCDHPDEAKRRPRVGALDSLSLEAILSLEPDAIVGAPGAPPSLLQRLTSLGVRVVLSSVESIDDVRVMARAHAALCDDADAARRWLATFDQQLSLARAVFAPAVAPRVLVVVDQRPLVCAGPGSYLDALLRESHAQNALATGPAWPQLSIESVIALAPDVVLDLCGPLAQAPLARVWSEHRAIPAIRARRVIAIDDPLVTRPGPRAPRAVELISVALRDALR